MEQRYLHVTCRSSVCGCKLDICRLQTVTFSYSDSDTNTVKCMVAKIRYYTDTHSSTCFSQFSLCVNHPIPAIILVKHRISVLYSISIVLSISGSKVTDKTTPYHWEQQITSELRPLVILKNIYLFKFGGRVQDY